MSPIVKVDMFTAVCDGCGTDLVESATGGEYSGYADDCFVLELVEDCGGVYLERGTEAVTVACEYCAGAYKELLDDQTWDLADGELRGHDAASEHGRALTVFLAARLAA